MSKASLVIVLAEDRMTQDFVRGYLHKLSYSNHDIRFEDVSAGKRGAGEQWVRDRYVATIAAYRHRAKKASTMAVIVVDADTKTVEQRLSQLAKALHPNAVKPEEKIAHLVPKHSIETWILCLSGTEVDEDTRYKKTSGNPQPSQARLAAPIFFDWSRPNATIPETCIPSLQRACAEVRRLE